MKKDFKWWLGLIIAILSALSAYMFSSCSAARGFYERAGHTTILTTDTTHVRHGGNIEIKIK